MCKRQRITFFKNTGNDLEVAYYGIVHVKGHNEFSIDFHPYGILIYFGDKNKCHFGENHV
jgi:hypothetical protein